MLDLDVFVWHVCAVSDSNSNVPAKECIDYEGLADVADPIDDHEYSNCQGIPLAVMVGHYQETGVDN